MTYLGYLGIPSGEMDGNPKLYKWKCIHCGSQVRNPEGLSREIWVETRCCESSIKDQLIARKTSRVLTKTISVVVWLALMATYSLRAATPDKRVSVFIVVQSEDAVLSTKIKDALVSQLAASGRVIVRAHESDALYAIRIAAAPSRARTGKSLGWVAGYALTGSAVCGTSKVRLLTILGSGVLQGSGDKVDMDDVMRSLVQSVEERLQIESDAPVLRRTHDP